MFDKHKTISYNTTPLSDALQTFGGDNTPTTQNVIASSTPQ